MSKHANPEYAFLALDADVYRGEAGAEIPDLAKMLDEDFKPEGFDPIGGIETGFNISSEGSANPKRVMNYRQAPYKVSREPRVDTITFKAVDTSIGAVKIKLQGGTLITRPDGTYMLEEGTNEEFSLLLVARDGEHTKAYYTERATLSTPPTKAAYDGDTLDGDELSVMALSPLREILTHVPDDLKALATKPAGASGAGTPGEAA